MRVSNWSARIVSVMAVLVAAGVAAAGNVPAGVTGLWRFQTSEDKLKATVGTDLTTSNPENSTWMLGPMVVIEPGMSDAGVVQEMSYHYLTVTHNIGANGGGSYVNQYTVAVDYLQTTETALWNGHYYNSLFQTNMSNSNDGDLFIRGPSRTQSVIGTADTGYSTLTFDSSQWHRIVWSVDNSSFFRVYVDGVMYLDGPAQGVDGRFSLDPIFLLFADNDWEDAWGLVATAAVWNRALTTGEIAGMGSTTTPLIVPEPAAMSLLLVLGGLFGLSRRVGK
ncbi:MAG TPA: PEP-CTERM sorting domain-containing protein [Phycisphaerae bacterium]|nr:PEP-CTERM sorting domain-containing protein [Phycisphaerae bacterium]HRY69596.1 PEP-CTERM sorting domain-containing protein [Phycisphaerae bacterium]